LLFSFTLFHGSPAVPFALTVVQVPLSPVQMRIYLCLPAVLKMMFATTATITSAMIHSVEDMKRSNAKTVNSIKRTMAIMPTVFFVFRTESYSGPLVLVKEALPLFADNLSFDHRYWN
jgi:hypothetical protein